MANVEVVDIAGSPGHTLQADAETENEAKHGSNAQDATLATQRKTVSRKRKRKRKNTGSGPGSHDRLESPPSKQRKTAVGATLSQPLDNVKHALLAQYYPTTLTLRQYILHHLPASSRLRRRKIAELGSGKESRHASDDRSQLCKLLDTTLVGLHTVAPGVAKQQAKRRLQQWIDYSQRDDSHVTLKGPDASAIHFQSEVGTTRRG